MAVSEFCKIKDYLVTEIRYKPDEIGVITGATSKPNRLKIQDDFNSGRVKIILGSEAIQEGMNLQQSTKALHMLSLPYNFTTLRQVEGRAWGQGNKHENVIVNFCLQMTVLMCLCSKSSNQNKSNEERGQCFGYF